MKTLAELENAAADAANKANTALVVYRVAATAAKNALVAYHVAASAADCAADAAYDAAYAAGKINND